LAFTTHHPAGRTGLANGTSGRRSPRRYAGAPYVSRLTSFRPLVRPQSTNAACRRCPSAVHSTEGLGVNSDALATLQSGPLHRFADWPNRDVPAVAIGLYTIWRREEFIYVGLAGRTSEAVLLGARRVGRACGLRDRLRSHASGRRSGDQFCVYVADRLVLPALTPQQIDNIAHGRVAFETLVRDYIQKQFTYRFFALPDLSVEAQRQARELERAIRRGQTPMGTPLLNSLRSP
jgi:hypothetical protein